MTVSIALEIYCIRCVYVKKQNAVKLKWPADDCMSLCDCWICSLKKVVTLT